VAQAQEQTQAVAQRQNPVARLKHVLSAESVKEQFENVLRESAGVFVASLLEVYSGDRKLQECDPNLVVREALKAATLKLPINRQLGFAALVVYAGKPQFQIGYRGYVQLAQRTGQYRYINADMVYEGEFRSVDKLTGALDIYGERTSNKVVGYFAYIETVTGFSKALYWTHEQVHAHAKRYAPSYGKPSSSWTTHPDDMCIKTVLARLLNKYGILSPELMTAFSTDRDTAEEAALNEDVDAEANGDIIDVEAAVTETPPRASTTKGGILFTEGQGKR